MHITKLMLRVAALFGTLALLHVGAIYSGFYGGKVWIDMPLHIIAGIALGLTWIWVADFRAARGGSRPDWLTYSAALLGFVLLASFAWESFEFLMREHFLELAHAWKIYPPNLSDTLSDMAFGLLGGLFSLPLRRFLSRVTLDE